jgi:23S rRNA U2552 (ribose-2'-O)-methylase RlmE/FtsJ
VIIREGGEVLVKCFEGKEVNKIQKARGID